MDSAGAPEQILGLLVYARSGPEAINHTCHQMSIEVTAGAGHRPFQIFQRLLAGHSHKIS